MIALFTDFSLRDPYVGQMHAVLARSAPGVVVIDLFHEVPSFDIRAAAYLLPVYAAPHTLPPGGVFVCVVDPGVGGARRPIMLEVEGRYYVGPHNGLFRVLTRRAGVTECREITWRPQQLSRSFHGRDLFAPVAAALSRGQTPESCVMPLDGATDERWPDDLDRILYVDHYGNAVTGIRAETLGSATVLQVRGALFPPAACFSDLPAGACCWYANANGLAEIAVNRGSAAAHFGLQLNDEVATVREPGRTSPSHRVS